MHPDDPIERHFRLIPAQKTALKRLKLGTIRNLLYHFPSRYEAAGTSGEAARLIPGTKVTLIGSLSRLKPRKLWKSKRNVTEGWFEDSSGRVKVMWFNQPYIKNILAPGRRANFAGKITESKKTGEMYLSNPTYELVNEHMNYETRHTGRIIPIYKETKGLTSKGIRFLIQPALKEEIDIPDIIPISIRETLELPDIQTAIQAVHFPNTIEDALSAKRRFAFEDLFLLQIITLKERMKIAAKKAHSIQADISFIKSLLETLPFELTES